MLDLARNANLALAFLLELAMLAAFATGALALDVGAMGRWAAAILVVAIVIAGWAIWAAPTSPTRLAGLALAGFKISLFALAALALLVSGQRFWALVFVLVSVLNFSLAWFWDQQ